MNHHDTQHNDTQHNDTHPIRLVRDTQHKRHSAHQCSALCWLSLCWMSCFTYCYAECHYTECRHADCRSTLARSCHHWQQAALTACTIFQYLHASEQYIACCSKWKHSVRRVAYTSGSKCYTRNFLETFFVDVSKLCLKSHNLRS